MKIETWYDIGCDICGRHWSTDFDHGWEEKRKGFSTKAKKEGWMVKDEKNICPICAKEMGLTATKSSRVKKKVGIPEEYMFKGSYEGGGFRIPSPIAKELGEKELEEIECPCCGQRNLRIADFGESGFFDAYQVVCDSCDWRTPTGTIGDYGEAPCDFKDWLEVFELLGRPKERLNEDLTLLLYPEGEWREKEREERKNNA